MPPDVRDIIFSLINDTGSIERESEAIYLELGALFPQLSAERNDGGKARWQPPHSLLIRGSLTGSTCFGVSPARAGPASPSHSDDSSTAEKRRRAMGSPLFSGGRGR